MRGAFVWGAALAALLCVGCDREGLAPAAPGASAEGDQSACPAGRADCDGDGANGCETSLVDSDQHCGKCGTRCMDGTHCRGRTCRRDAMLAVGSGFAGYACALEPSGKVFCWGANGEGQLGDGTRITRPRPVAVAGLQDAVFVAAGDELVCAVRQSGEVACWGSNVGNVLGDKALERFAKPVPIQGLSDAKAVAVGNGHACALRRGGEVACWGRNEFGQLGDGSSDGRPTPKPVPGLKLVAQIAVASFSSCARSSGGAVHCWGYNHDGRLGVATRGAVAKPEPVPTLSDAEHLSVGKEHACAVRRSGAVVCWGGNAWSKLGSDSGPFGNAPAEVQGLKNAVRVSAGPEGSCAILRDGRASCWGKDPYHPSGFASATPKPVSGLEQVSDIGVGTSFSCAATRAKGVSCWGRNAHGRLGTGKASALPTPVVVPGIDDAVQVAADMHFTCARRRGGEVSCWGLDPYLLDAESKLKPHGVPPARVAGLEGVTDLIASGHAYAVAGSGKVMQWRGGLPAYLDETKNGEYQPAVVVGLNGVQTVESASTAHLKTGMVSLFMSMPEELPGGKGRRFKATVVSVPRLGRVSAVASITDVRCAIREGGKVVCWREFVMGPRTEPPTFFPVKDLSDAESVAVDDKKACAVRQTGEVVCWPAPRPGEKPNADGVPFTKLAGVADAARVAMAHEFWCVRTKAGSVLCWGKDNSVGQLGNGSFDPSDDPKPVLGVSHAVDLDLGNAHGCAVLEDGKVMCWGANGTDQAGQQDDASSATPVQVVGLPG